MIDEKKENELIKLRARAKEHSLRMREEQSERKLIWKRMNPTTFFTRPRSLDPIDEADEPLFELEDL